jgi:hypothetical protein
MLTTLALLTLSMAPAQTGEPEFKNVRFTYGLLGQARKDDKFLPGDAVYLAFDVGNMKVKEDGRVLYAIGLEVNKKGDSKPILKREPQDMEVTNTLGGGTFPSIATWTIPRDKDAPGEYTLKITVKDRGRESKPATLTRKFTVLKPQLGFIHVFLTTWRGEAVPPIAAPGQRMMVNYALAGFEFDKKENQCHLTVTIRVLDADGKPTLAKPSKGTVKGSPKEAPGVMAMSPFSMDLNKPGRFKIELKATDHVTGKTAEQTLDVRVIEIK